MYAPHLAKYPIITYSFTRSQFLFKTDDIDSIRMQAIEEDKGELSDPWLVIGDDSLGVSLARIGALFVEMVELADLCFSAAWFWSFAAPPNAMVVLMCL